MHELRDKWKWVANLVWVMAVMSVFSAAWVAWEYGMNAGAGDSEVNFMIVAASAVQAAGGVLTALIVSMLHSIYQTATDVWVQNQQALRHRRD